MREVCKPHHRQYFEIQVLGQDIDKEEKFESSRVNSSREKNAYDSFEKKKKQAKQRINIFNR